MKKNFSFTLFTQKKKESLKLFKMADIVSYFIFIFFYHGFEIYRKYMCSL